MAEELDEPVFLSWEQYWGIAVRRRRWIFLSLFSVWAAVWGASWFLPVTYQSESLILVEQQKVPDQYVVPNVTSNLQERLQNLTEQILSRTRLQATITQFHLYSGQGGFLKAGDPVEQMRRDIKIDLVSAPDHPGEYTAFSMRYSICGCMDSTPPIGRRSAASSSTAQNTGAPGRFSTSWRRTRTSTRRSTSS